MGYLLKDSWLTKGIEVFVGNGDKPIWSNTVKEQQKLREETLNARGDPNLQFSAMIYLEKKTDGTWDVREAQSLDG